MFDLYSYSSNRSHHFNTINSLNMIATYNGWLVDGIPIDEQGLRELRKFDEELQKNKK